MATAATDPDVPPAARWPRTAAAAPAEQDRLRPLVVTVPDLLRLTRRYRLRETTRAADHLSRAVLADSR